MSVCTLCPRKCGVDREIMRGYCQSGDKNAHCAREAPLLGGAAHQRYARQWHDLFTGCSLRCAFCQNSEISGESLHGKDFTVEEFIETIKNSKLWARTTSTLLRRRTLHRKLPKRCASISRACPLSANCGGYESVETLRMLEGSSTFTCRISNMRTTISPLRLSNAPHYCETALAAIHEMVRQTGENVYDENGMLQTGIIIRQLILPATRAIPWRWSSSNSISGRAREPDEPVYADGTCFARAGICGHQPPHHPAGEPQGTKLYVGTGFARLLPKRSAAGRTLYTGFYTV